MRDTDRSYDASRPAKPLESGNEADDADRIKSRQRLRLWRATLAVAGIILNGFDTLYLYLSGQLALDPIAAVSPYIAVFVAYGFFFWLIATGRNLHFRDPSLTWPQMTLGTGLTIFLFSFGRTILAQDLYFIIFLMTLLFSAFRLDLKQILVTELPAFIVLAAVLLLHHGLIHEALGVAAERIAIYFGLMGWIILFAMIISHLRQALSTRNKELKQALDRVNEMAARDDLTGAYNRRYLFQALKREIERSKRSGDPLCVCMFDVDHFKAINDSHGHQVGDDILCELIKRTRDSIRGADELRPLADGHVLGRFGGEEFLITLPLTDLDGAASCAERVRNAIRSQPFITRTTPIKVSVSLGIAQYNNAYDTSDTLVERADAALYKAKTNGRDQVVTAPIDGDMLEDGV